MTQDFSQKTCHACEGGVAPVAREEAERHLELVNSWRLTDDSSAITRSFTFTDFAEALVFVNSVGEIAEQEGHHPDILLHGYNNVVVTLSTHAIGGLSENDFIVAAKIDEVART